MFLTPPLPEATQKGLHRKIGSLQRNTLRKKYPYTELFWSVFFRIWTEYGKVRIILPYSVRMRENTEQNNSEYGHFSRSDIYLITSITIDLITIYLMHSWQNQWNQMKIVKIVFLIFDDKDQAIFIPSKE